MRCLWILTIKSDVIAVTLLAIISHSSPATISILQWGGVCIAQSAWMHSRGWNLLHVYIAHPTEKKLAI